MPSIHIKSIWTALIVALVYSVINVLLGGLLRFISWPFIFITFGLFKLVINTILLWITDKLIEDFKIDGLINTFYAAVLITIFDSLLRWIF